MKTYFSILFLLFGSLIANAQNLSIPRDEFAVGLPNIPIKIQRGDSTNLTLFILKSKGFIKAKTALKMNSHLPKGVFIKISPDTGVFDKATVSISITDEAEVGLVSLIIAAEMRHIKKGTITSFEIL